jgi:predicted metal-dependent hydrolase
MAPATDTAPVQLSLFGEPAGESAGRPGAAQTPAPVPTPLAPPPDDADHARTTAETAMVFRHPRAEREVALDGHLVAYAFRRARRRSIGFVVGPEGLSVSAPRWVGRAEVDAALREKSRWILRKLQEQGERSRRLEQARVNWSDGATLPFLGQTVTVVVDPRVTGALLQPGTDPLPGVPHLTLHVGLPQGAAAGQVREVVQSWLQRQARRIFEERCALFAPRLGVRYTRLSLSSASTRWGSASADGSIRLNWRLVHFGLPVIDYVVAHELAHLREMNHSPTFWQVVRSVVPDVDSARGALRKEVLPVFD